MRILLADDHDLVRETLAAFLLAEGFAEVRTVATLESALQALAGTGGSIWSCWITTCRG